MNEQLIIGIPYIYQVGNRVRLEAEISSSSFDKKYYFEVDKKYGKYFCETRSDAFLMGLMYFALVNSYDIECKAPLSEKLYYQLTETYIPTVVKNDPELFHNIVINAKLDSSRIDNIGGVGASVSGGIDSFYTILKNLNGIASSYNVTHLLLTNCFNIYFGEQDTRERFERIVASGKAISDQLGLEFIDIYTNEHIFWYPHFINLYCFRYMSLVYALQKLFSVYHYSSGHTYEEFSFKAYNRDASRYDFFTAHLISNENLTIYSSGGEANRTEKALFISDNTVVQNNLHVCNIDERNCGICEKCLRTELNLYAVNKLHKFSNVFDMTLFEQRRDSAIISMLERRRDYDNDVLEMMDRNGIPISNRVRIRGKIGRIIVCIKKVLKKSRVISNIVKIMKKRKGITDHLGKSELYNIDYEFAKECDPEVIR